MFDTVYDDSGFGVLSKDVQGMLLQDGRIVCLFCLQAFVHNASLVSGVDVQRQNVPSVQCFAIYRAEIEGYDLTFRKTKGLWLIYIMIEA